MKYRRQKLCIRWVILEHESFGKRRKKMMSPQLILPPTTLLLRLQMAIFRAKVGKVAKEVFNACTWHPPRTCFHTMQSPWEQLRGRKKERGRMRKEEGPNLSYSRPVPGPHPAPQFFLLSDRHWTVSYWDLSLWWGQVGLKPACEGGRGRWSAALLWQLKQVFPQLIRQLPRCYNTPHPTCDCTGKADSGAEGDLSVQKLS